uniref:Uncharacterized protein n=1 Tax=Cacopsylla melanoneura TaxID=428564 RepID=A0A8D8QPY6_9HEMI
MNRIESVLLSGYFSWGFLDEWEFLVGYFIFFFFRNFSLLFIHYFLPLLLSQVFVFLLSQVFAFLGEESVEVMVYNFSVPRFSVRLQFHHASYPLWFKLLVVLVDFDNRSVLISRL